MGHHYFVQVDAVHCSVIFQFYLLLKVNYTLLQPAYMIHDIPNIELLIHYIALQFREVYCKIYKTE